MDFRFKKNGLPASHRFCYLIFLRRFEFLNEITVVKTVEKNLVCCSESWGISPITKTKRPKFYTLLTSLDTYLLETLP